MTYGITIHGSVYIEVEANDEAEARDIAHDNICWGDFEDEIELVEE